jgi:PAS domain S-box-containing protein
MANVHKKDPIIVTENSGPFREIFNQNKSVMLLIDPGTGKILDANFAAQDFYGFKNLLNENIADINLLPEQEVLKLMNTAVTKNRNHFLFSHQLATGEIRDVEVYSTPLLFKEKRLLLSIVHDITQRKKAEKQTSFLSKSTFKLIKLKTPEEVYRFTTRQLNKFFGGDAIIAVTEYDNPNNHWKMMDVAGVNPTLEKTLQAFGFDLQKMEGDISTQFLSEVEKEKLSELEFDLYKLTNGKTPRKLSDSLKKLLPDYRLLVMPFKKNDVIYGTVTICVRKSEKNFTRHFIEAFISQVAVFLEKLLAEQDLEKSESYYRALIENATDIVSILDEKGTILFKSNSHFSILGYSEGELIGVNAMEKIHPDDQPEVLQLFREILPNPGKSIRFEYRFQHKNGTWKYMEGTARNLLQNPAVKGIVINSRDITEKMEFEQQLIEAKEKAEESERLKTAFLANMSHEIRTPMNGILGFIDILNEPGISEDDRENYFELVKKSGERLLTTINDIIEISKIEANQTYLNFTDENLGEILQEHLRFFRPEADKKGISLQLLENPTHRLNIRTDKNKLDSILTNLIKNALKFTLKGTIEFGCHQQNNQLVFFVQDTGIGIARERIEAIFNRFEQAEIGISRGHEGTGLGLSISRAYAEMLGGRLWVESEKGKGSTFYFSVNYVPASGEKTQSSDENNGELEHLHNAGTILIAEDDAVSFSLLESYLSKENFKLIHAKNGQEAIQVVREKSDIDLILMDVRMPKLDGYTAIKEIKKINPEIPVIAQTAYALEGDREKALKAGCVDYIAKPLRKNELIQKIKEVIG